MTDTLPIVERIRSRINDAPMPTEYLLDQAADIIDALAEALHGLVERITEAWPELANLPPMETARAALARAKGEQQ